MKKQYKNWDNFITEEFKKDKKLADYSLKRSLRDYENNGNIELLLLSMRHIAEAKGISYIAKKTKLSRTAIYKALSANGNPTITTLKEILNTLGYTFHFRPVQ
jgi:probable addiction module antidote protein